MSHVEQLKHQLDSMGVTIKGLTLGTNSGDSESVAQELLKSLKSLQSGDFEEVISIDD